MKNMTQHNALHAWMLANDFRHCPLVTNGENSLVLAFLARHIVLNPLQQQNENV
jgi:hypothetical protein